MSDFSKIFFILIIISLKTFAQIDVSTIQKTGEIDIQSQTQLYIDSTAKLDLKIIKNKQFKPLNAYKLPTLAIQNYQNHYWLKFILNNNSDDTLRLVFTAGYHFAQNLYDDDKMIHTDMSLRRTERPVYFDDKYLPITLPPNQSKTYYIELINLIEKHFEIAPKILTEQYSEHKKLASFYNDSYPLSVNYALVSILFFMGLFLLLQYFFSRQRYFLYYSFYLFSMWFFSIWGFSHSPFVSSLMNYFPFLKFTLRQNFYVLTTQYFYFLFLTEFLEIHLKYPKIDRFLKVFRRIIFYLILLELFFTLIYRRLDFEIYLTIISQIFLSIGGIIANFLILRIKGKSTNFIKVGSMSLLFAALFGFFTIYYKIFPESTDIFPHYPNLFFNYFVLLEILCFSLGIGYKYLESIRDKARLQREVSQSELNVLRLQINPHFIFNSLNSIKSFILKKRTQEASQYLTDFSQLFRAVLEQSREPIITLKEEIETLLLYIKLEQKRLQDKFELVYKIDESTDNEEVAIPSLLLQPYIENAIKHGLSPLKSGGILKLEFEKEDEFLICKIEDNGIGRRTTQSQKKDSQHHSMGTQIIDERLQLFRDSYNWDITVTIIDKYDGETPTGTLVVVRIPIH
jgi:sensor histidine kinase YesM